MDNTKKITKGMTGPERYDILKERYLPVVGVNNEKLSSVSSESMEKLISAGIREVKSTIKQIGEKFGIYKEYENADIQMIFHYSRAGLNESVEKQGKNYPDFVKMMTCLDDVVKNAVGVAVEDIRNYTNSPQKTGNMYILTSAFHDGRNIYPVKLEVKEQNKGEHRTLYVAITETKIPARKIKKADFYGVRGSKNLAVSFPLPTFDISIRYLFEKINRKDGNFLKYLPDAFLSRRQRRAKQKALDGQQEYMISKQNSKLNQTIGIGSGKKISPRTEPTPPTPPTPPTVPTGPNKTTQGKAQSKVKGKGKKNFLGL